MILFTIILTLFSLTVFADIARPDKSPNRVPKPKPQPGVMTRMEIKLDRNATEARLIIPKQQLNQLRAELEQLDNESDSTAAEPSSVSFLRVQTIVSGVFLSLAVVFAGLWFARSSKAATETGKNLVVLAAIAGAVSAATFVYGNAGPPSEARSITGKMFAQGMHYYKMGWGEVRLEIGEGEEINFIVPDPQPKPTPTE